MNEFVLAGMLMSLGVVSVTMIWSQSRKRHGKQSVSDSIINWVARRIA